MKLMRKIPTLIQASLAVAALIFASISHAKEGEALQRKKNLKFDGSTIEAVGGGRFNSFTHLSEGDDGAGKSRLYELPANFQKRTAGEAKEMRYRK